MRSRDFDKDFDKSFRRMERFFWIFLTVVLVLIFGSWILYGNVALYVLDNPQSVGEWLGKLMGGITSD
jgi:uncharacterized membrane protein YdfJ with MMPL/SSD domain